MAAYEVLLLNTAIPQIQAAQSGDTYVVPRDIAFSAALTLSAGTANGVPYLNASKVLTTGSALTFDGTNFGVGFTANARGGVVMTTTNNSGISEQGGYQVTNGNGTGLFAGVNGASFTTGGIGNANNAVLYSIGNTDLVFGRNTSEAMRLTTTGLGIGTNNPAYKLDVNTGQIRAQESGTGSGDGSLIGATVSANGNAGVLFQTNSVSRWNLTTQGTAGANLRIYNYTLGATVATFDSSGNLGLGVTPSAWGSGWPALQVGSRTVVHSAPDGRASFGGNYYVDGTNARYIASAEATQLMQVSGQFRFFTAPSGNANDPITFTQAMTLDASGRLLVKATSNTGTNTKLAVGSGLTSGNAVAYISTEDVNVDGVAISNWTGSATTNRVSLAFDSSGVGSFRIGMPGGVNAFQIYDSLAGAERARITSGGYFKASNDGTYLNTAGTYHEINQTANDNVLFIRSTDTAYSVDGVQLRFSRNTTNNSFYVLSYYNATAAAYKFRVADSGDVTNTNGTYGTISDAKMKTDIVDAGSQWADIKALRFRKFKMKDDPSGLVQLGVVAQEVEQTSPGLVDEHADRDAEGNDLGTTTKSVKTSVLLMKAAVALQEAMARIEKLEAEVAALKGA